jgi:tetratricopeptide (TPR) repeat protein
MRGTPCWAPLVTVLAIAALDLASPGTRSAAAELPAARALDAYVLDTHSGGRLLRAAGRLAAADVSPAALLALGDAQLRRGRLHAAEVTLHEAEASGSPWAELAALGLGAIRLAEGDTAAARANFARAERLQGDTGKLAALLGRLADAAEGDREAAQRLQALSDDEDALLDLRLVARLGVGYATYWTGDYRAARAAFQRAARDLAGSRLEDDARYGAALALRASGDFSGARRELVQLAAASRPSPRARGEATLVSLEPRALLRAAFRALHQVQGPLLAPEAQAIALIDHDGVALARAALRQPLRMRAASDAARANPSSTIHPLDTPRVVTGIAPAPTPARSQPRPWMVLAAATIAAALGPRMLLRRRIQPKQPVAPWR